MPTERRKVGEVRPTQVLHTFGIGSVVDLPNFSALVMGLEQWAPPDPETEISDERLLGLVKNHLGSQVERLAGPPTQESQGSHDPFSEENRRGLPVIPFPGWVRCPTCDLIGPLDSGVFELDADPWRPDRTRYVHSNCPKGRGRRQTVVPVRFIRACEAGHLDDFPWVEFVHRGETKCHSVLRLYEFGVSAEAADITVKCETCNQSRRMMEAFGEEASEALGGCSGSHPHLYQRGGDCEEEMKAMLVGASNIWFPVSASALTIVKGADLAALVKERWAVLKQVTSPEVLGFARSQMRELADLREFTDQQIWEAIQAEHAGTGGGGVPKGVNELKREEWEIFTRPDEVPPSENLQVEELDLK